MERLNAGGKRCKNTECMRLDRILSAVLRRGKQKCMAALTIKTSKIPKLETAEFNTQAPTVYGYYLDLLSRDTEGKFLCLLKDNCYVGFHSGGMQVIYAGDYSRIQSLEPGAAGADSLIYKTFQSGRQTDYLLYAVNIFGGLFLIVVLWLLLMIAVRVVCRI